MEKTFMQTRGSAKILYRKYPNFFVTKKSSKSRMGKGKGKIAGRVLKIRPSETLVDLRLNALWKSYKHLTALRMAIPGKCKLVYKSR
jgi:ribosomal protein L16/L10AE